MYMRFVTLFYCVPYSSYTILNVTKQTTPS